MSVKTDGEHGPSILSGCCKVWANAESCVPSLYPDRPRYNASKVAPLQNEHAFRFFYV